MSGNLVSVLILSVFASFCPPHNQVRKSDNQAFAVSLKPDACLASERHWIERA